MHVSLAQGRLRKTLARGCCPAALVLLTFACAAPAWAQKVTVVENLTAEQALAQMANPLGVGAVGEAIGLSTAIEIATAPFGTSSGGFVFKLDPATGLLTRTTTTFGPAFADRAITSGEGQISVGATFSASSYDELSGFSLANLPIGSIVGGPTARTGTGNFDISSKTLAISSTIGVTPNFDVGVVVPLITLKVQGTTTLVNAAGVAARVAVTDSVYSGLGDLLATAKYRFVKFGSSDIPDPGGIALLVNMRLPTGDRENLRGLGVTRTLIGAAGSAGTGKLRPHASAGFEIWSKGVDLATGVPSGGTVSARHQIQYAAGIELEAAPKLTILVDYLGQHILGAGQVDVITQNPTNALGITSISTLAAIPDGIRKALLVPGLKLNVKGKMLLSLHALVTMSNNGLRANITPVAGLNLTM